GGGGEGGGGERPGHCGWERGRDPAADREADEIGALEAKAIEELEIEVGDVVHAVEPVRQRRFPETRMRRGDHAPLLGEKLDERRIDREPGAAVQIENRRTLAALDELELDAADGVHWVLRR